MSYTDSFCPDDREVTVEQVDLALEQMADESGGWLWLLADGPAPSPAADPVFDDPPMTALTPPGYSRDHAGG